MLQYYYYSKFCFCTKFPACTYRHVVAKFYAIKWITVVLYLQTYRYVHLCIQVFISKFSWDFLNTAIIYSNFKFLPNNSDLTNIYIYFGLICAQTNTCIFVHTYKLIRTYMYILYYILWNVNYFGITMPRQHTYEFLNMCLYHTHIYTTLPHQCSTGICHANNAHC